MFKFKYFLVLFFYYNYNSVETTNVADSWIKFISIASGYMVNCSNSENTIIPWQCIRNGSILIFDQITECDVIPLMDNMRLKRFRKNQNNLNLKSFIDFRQNDKKLSFEPTNTHSWSYQILKRFIETLNTHAFEIDLGGGFRVESRNRRRHQMLPMMMFGITAFGMILVPIGFQFLAMVAGKALLLAKMALLLSSINGLKRVATSGVSYGFYRAPHLYGGSEWDRIGSPHDNGPR